MENYQALNENIQIFSGNDVVIVCTVTFVPSDGSPELMNLTGCQAEFHVTARASGGEMVLKKVTGRGVTILDQAANLGKLKIVMDRHETKRFLGRYFYSILVKHPTIGFKTVAYGDFLVMHGDSSL